MARHVRIAAVWAVLIGVLAAVTAPAAEKPLAVDDLVALIELQIDDTDIVARIQKGGVAFSPDDASIARLKLGVEEAAILKRLDKSPTVLQLDAAQRAELKSRGASDKLLAALTGAAAPSEATTDRADDARPGPNAAGEHPGLAGWGEFVDPAGDCHVNQANGIVTITVPGTEHNLNPIPEYDNVLGPRVLQPVEGDFEIQVTVQPFPRPTAGTSTNQQGHSYIAAGLVVWQNDKTFFRWLRAANGERSELFVHAEAFRDAQRASMRYRQERNIPDQPTFLRIARRQGQFTVSYSQDGRRWTDYASMPDDGYGEKLQVGLGVVNATNVTFAPRFTELRVTAATENR